LIEVCSKVLSEVSVYVGKNVKIGDIEVDIISLIPDVHGVSVHLFEAKAKPKWKLIKQILSRYDMADYLYVVLPYTSYLWASSAIPEYVGIVLIDKHLNPILMRFPKWLGNGTKCLKYLAMELI